MSWRCFRPERKPEDLVGGCCSLFWRASSRYRDRNLRDEGEERRAAGSTDLYNRSGLRSILQVERIVQRGKRKTCEIDYYISSSTASAEKRLTVVRKHWKIESLHWILDVVFSEEASRFYSENAYLTLNSVPRVLSYSILTSWNAPEVRYLIACAFRVCAV